MVKDGNYLIKIGKKSLIYEIIRIFVEILEHYGFKFRYNSGSLPFGPLFFKRDGGASSCPSYRIL
jgi:hypothetical protein